MGVFFLGDLGAFVYYLCVPNQQFITVEGWSPETTRGVTIGSLGGAMALWLILSICCCCCYKKARRNEGPTTVTYVEPMEMGGGPDLEVEVEVEAEIEVEVEAPEIEVEVEIEAPEV